jgi:phage terminase small subunit
MNDNSPAVNDQNQTIESTTPPAKIENRGLVEQTKGSENPITEAKTPTAANTLDKSTSLPSLSIREKAFIQALTDKDSDTFDHYGKAYAKAYGRELDQTASVSGSRLMKKDKIRTWIDDILEKQNAGIEVRVATLASIALNRTAPRRIKRQTVTRDGDIVDLIEEHEPSHADRIKAVDVLNKLSGVYDTQRHNDRLAEIEYKELCKRNFKDRLDGKSKRKSKERDVTGSGADGKTGEGD